MAFAFISSCSAAAAAAAAAACLAAAASAAAACASASSWACCAAWACRTVKVNSVKTHFPGKFHTSHHMHKAPFLVRQHQIHKMQAGRQAAYTPQLLSVLAPPVPLQRLPQCAAARHAPLPPARHAPVPAASTRVGTPTRPAGRTPAHAQLVNRHSLAGEERMQSHSHASAACCWRAAHCRLRVAPYATVC